jgi:hypothetical protein
MAMKRKLDFTNVEEGFSLIPKGIYAVYVFDIQEKTSSAGNDMMKVILKIADGEFKGRQVFANLTFVDTAMFKIREFLVACGATIPKKTVDIDFSKCVGKKIRIEVQHRTSKEKPDDPFADVKKFLPLTDSATVAIANNSNPPETADDKAEELPFK